MTGREDVSRTYAIGTRAVVYRDGAWRVVCATCHAGGCLGYRSRSDALQVATRDSCRECRQCGAR